MSNFHHKNNSSGFTLVEISMVMLLFASAVGGLLSFFPVGLRMEANAISDSAQTMFALDVLARVEANAAEITDWDDWDDNKRFISKAFNDIKVGVESSNPRSISTNFKTYKSKLSESSSRTVEILRTDEIVIEEYLTRRGNMRYVIQVAPIETPIAFDPISNKSRNKNHRIRRIAIWVTDRRDGDPFMNTPFTLDLIFNPSLDKIMEGGV